MKRVEPQWGTAIGVEVDDGVDPSAVDAAFTWFARVDALFSTWRDDSELMRIVRGDLALADADPDVRAVLGRCDELRVETGGAFDVAATARLLPPHAPGWSPLDPSGMVKGWALDRAAEQLLAAGARSVCINAGGDVVVRGAEPWRVGIQHPTVHDKVAAVVAVTDTGVATSGRYERGDHVVDPRSGCRASGLASVTVLAPELATADAYATAAVAVGRDALDLLAGLGVDALVVTDDGDAYRTPGFAALEV